MQSFWHAMRDGLPEGCRAPLSPTCRWRRRAHCRHQGDRLCLGEPPWQPRSANAMVAAPRRARNSRSDSSALSACSTSFLHSSSSSSRERASWEAARRDVPAACARACRLSDEDPPWGRGPRHRCPTRTSTSTAVLARLQLPMPGARSVIYQAAGRREVSQVGVVVELLELLCRLVCKHDTAAC